MRGGGFARGSGRDRATRSLESGCDPCYFAILDSGVALRRSSKSGKQGQRSLGPDFGCRISLVTQSKSGYRSIGSGPRDRSATSFPRETRSRTVNLRPSVTSSSSTAWSTIELSQGRPHQRVRRPRSTDRSKRSSPGAGSSAVVGGASIETRACLRSCDSRDTTQQSAAGHLRLWSWD